MLCKRLAKTLVNLTGSVRHIMSKELIINQFGNPLQVVQMREGKIACLGGQDVLVRMLAAPINPFDINTIEGKYPIPMALPHIPGNEGVGVVEKVGSCVSSCQPGSRVVVTSPGQGTWRDIGIFNECVLKVVPKCLGLIEAATLAINPCTAYRLLSDFKPLRQCNMSIIQNGANGSCGQYIIQLCKAWGIQNINIVRCRRKMDELTNHLKSLGASIVLKEEDLRATTIFKDNLIYRPSLALNCVGGKSATEMVRQLTPNGCMVTYGGMSKQPVTIPTPAFVFKNMSFIGFWMNAWNTIASDAAKHEMLTELITLMANGQITAPVHKKVDFVNFQEAICKSMRGYQGCKFVLVF